MNAIHCYGRPPAGINAGDAPEDWFAFGTQETWERYLQTYVEDAFARDVERGVANTDQYQLMSSTFRYDPAVGGVVVDYPF